MKNNLTLKGEATKKKIFEASIKLFKEFGYKNTSIKAICKEAKIGTGTFYHHFTSKKDIIFAFVEHEEKAIIHSTNTNKTSSCYENIIETLKLQYKFLEIKDKEFLSYFMSFNIIDSYEINKFINSPVRKHIYKNLKLGEELNQFKCYKSPEYSTSLLVNLFFGHTVIWSSNKSEENLVSLDNLFQEILDLINFLVIR